MTVRNPAPYVQPERLHVQAWRPAPQYTNRARSFR
jgi:hypothetical protein